MKHLNLGFTPEEIAEQECVSVALVRMDIARLGPLDYVQTVFSFYKDVPVRVPEFKPMAVVPDEPEAPKKVVQQVVQLVIPFPEFIQQFAEAA